MSKHRAHWREQGAPSYCGGADAGMPQPQRNGFQGFAMIASIAARVCIYTLDTVASSVYLYTMKPQDIIKALKSDGWKQVSQKGSHVQFKHPTKTGRVTVPHPNKDVPIGTLRSIEKQATIKLR